MGRKKMLVADLLCGAGGSSTGCARALRELGLEMELVCVNHWPVALDTHSKNHPEARHYCSDISTVRPHMVVPEGYLDLLMASPTCTHHSVARGGKPTSDQQRSDPWHIITWLTELRVKRMIIENVWEFINWGPVDARTGKPIQSRKGEYFNAWINVIRTLGYEPEWRKLNAADYGDATTRQRFILMARSDRRSISWPPPTHRKREDGKLEFFPGVKPWRPAREIIDWDIKGRSIFNRKKALAPKTLARIYAGAVKFNWPEPFLVILRNHMNGKSVDGPLPTISAGGTHIGLAQPMLVKQNFRRDTQGVDEPVPTVMTQARIGLIEPVGQKTDQNGEPIPSFDDWYANTKDYGGDRHEYDSLYPPAEPIIVSPRHGKDGGGPRPRSVDDPIPTVTGGGSQFAMAEPVIVNMKGKSTATDIQQPVPTQTSHAGHIAVAEPIITNGRKNNKARGVSTEPVPTLDTKGGVWLAEAVAEAVVVRTNMHGRKSPGARSADDPLMTITTDGGIAVAEAFVLAPGSTGAPRETGEPLPTITTGGAGVEERPGCARPMLVEPFILNRHGADGGSDRSKSVSEPTPPATTSGAGYLVEPFIATVAHGNSEGDETADIRRSHSLEDPLGTVHAGGGKYAVVEPSFVLSRHAGGAPRSVDEPTPTQVAKQSHVLISPYYGSGSGETCVSAEEPLPTVTSKNRFGMVVPVTQKNGGAVARSTDDPVPTMTTAKGGEFAIVMPVTHSDSSDRVRDPSEPLPTVTGANRGELAFITAQHGERPGQAPRVHDVDEPAPTIAATGHVDLIEGTEQYDILFRMLEPHELAAAMGFNDEDAYEFSGTKTQKIKQIGNAVSVAKMRACVLSIMADAAPKERSVEAPVRRAAAG